MLNEVIHIAREAGRIILTYYNEDIQVIQKEDESPLTQADLAADKYIVANLKELTPEIPIISEETGIPEYSIRKDWSKFWLVDPLDGTKEFIKRNGEFTVNIALIDNGEPVMGVIYVPVQDLIYSSQKGSGSWKIQSQGTPIQIYSKQTDKTQPFSIVESRSHGSPESEEWIEKHPINNRVKAGSSLKFCLVAEGKVDVYPRIGPTREWDVAAGDCIYRNSAIEGQHASTLQYNKEDFRNPNFIIGF